MELSNKKTISYGRLILVLIPAIAMVIIVGLAVINGGGSPPAGQTEQRDNFVEVAQDASPSYPTVNFSLIGEGLFWLAFSSIVTFGLYKTVEVYLTFKREMIDELEGNVRQFYISTKITGLSDEQAMKLLGFEPREIRMNTPKSVNSSVIEFESA